MRDVLEEDGHGVRPAAVFAVAAIAVISVAVLHNSLFRQAGVALPVTHLAVDAQSPRTVRLKHDPLLEEVQRQLLAAGYYKGPIDGVAGTHAREAIESYQHATGIAVTGTATPGLAEHIRYTREIAETTLFKLFDAPKVKTKKKAVAAQKPDAQPQPVIKARQEADPNRTLLENLFGSSEKAEPPRKKKPLFSN